MSGDISLRSTQGDIQIGKPGGERTWIHAGGHLALHAQQDLDLRHTLAYAGASLAATSATADIESSGSAIVAQDLLSLNAAGSQRHADARINGGAVVLQTRQGGIALDHARLAFDGNLRRR